METLYHRELPFRLLGQVVPPVVCERDDAVALPAERHGRVQLFDVIGDGMRCLVFFVMWSQGG